MEPRILLLCICAFLALTGVEARPHKKSKHRSHRNEFLSWENRDFWPSEIESNKQDLNGIVPKKEIISPDEQKIEKNTEVSKSEQIDSNKGKPDSQPFFERYAGKSGSETKIQNNVVKEETGKDKNLIKKDLEYDESDNDEDADEQYDYDDDYNDYDNDDFDDNDEDVDDDDDEDVEEDTQSDGAVENEDETDNDDEDDDIEDDEEETDDDDDDDDEDEDDEEDGSAAEKTAEKAKETIPEQLEFASQGDEDEQFDSLPVVAKKSPIIRQKKTMDEQIGSGIDSVYNEPPKEAEKVTKVKEIIRTSPNPPTSTATQKVSLHVENEKKSPERERYIQSIPYMSCQIESDCSPGRACINGVCMCGMKDYCLSHSKPVCGSDGILYDSHCELHRTACHSRIHIKIDHQGLCFEKEKEDETVGFVNDSELPIEPEHKIKLSEPSHKDIPIEMEQTHKAEVLKEEPISEENETTDKKEIISMIPADDKGKDEVKGEVKDEVKDEVKLKVKEEPKKEEAKIKPIHIKLGNSGSILEVEPLTKPCNVEDFMNFKAKLLKYHCEKYDGKACLQHPTENKLYISTLMFSDFDRDLDGIVTTKELGDIEIREDFRKLSQACTLLDMIKHDDINQDGRLTSDEFCKAFDLPAMMLEDTTKEVTTLATEGNGLEIKCGILSGEDKENRIIWKRYGVDVKEMNTPELTVFEDGSLYFRFVGIHHIGNYTCVDKEHPFLTQTHILKVQKPPIVKVASHTKIHGGHADIRMECHADGVPRPKITWKKNELPIPEEPSHFIHKSNEGMLVIHNPDFHRDTGAYKCSAKNQAGSAHDITTVFIQNPNATHKYAHSRRTRLNSYMVFHSSGYEVYDPEFCNLRRNIEASFSSYKLLPDEIDGEVPPLCVKGQGCDWHQAVNVKDKFIYVSQPKQKRVIVIGVQEGWDPVEIISTDSSPYDLHYVEYLDELWMLTGDKEVDGVGKKIILVIRDASRDTQHHTVHTQPVGDRFDQVDAMFIPLKNNLDHSLRYGYVRHFEQRGLYKIDLEEMNYVGSMDFSYLDCIPNTVAFVPLGGYTIIQCISGIEGNDKNIQLVLDYMSNELIANFTLSGVPHVSPDSRYIVTADAYSRILHVVKVSDEGVLSEPTLITVGTFISDVAFFPATGRDGYNLYIRSSEREEVTLVDLETGTTEKMRWKAFPKSKSKLGDDTVLSRTVTAGDIFMEYLVTSLEDAAVIMDGTYNVEHCRFNNIHLPNVVLFTSSDLD